MSRVSVIIPNYNFQKWIAGAIYSAVNDQYPNKQIIVVDDGSTDDSWPIICRSLKLPGIASDKVLCGNIGDIQTYGFRFSKNRHQANALNKAIEIGWDSTDIFGVLDADDEYRQGKIAKSVAKIESDPIHIGAVYTDYDTLDEKGVYRREYKQPFSREVLIRENIVHSACVINKKALEAVGIYDGELSPVQDYDLWVRISERFVITHIPEPLMTVRVGSHSSVHTINKEIWIKNIRRIFEKLQERIHNG